MDKPVDERRRLEHMSVEELADWAASTGPNSDNDQVARAEFLRRQTSALEDTALYTRRGAMAMMVSTAILALLALVGAFFGLRRRRPEGQTGQRGQTGQNRPAPQN